MVEKLGRYELLEKIGEGGFAIVYRARDLELDRLVALKELRSLLLTDPTWVKRFRREAKAIARLDHPQIVAIYDVGQAGGRHFIVMRLVDGLSLDEMIAKRGRLPWPELLAIAMATTEGLAYAHSRGILHRDLKPGNILIDSERGPMLTDFGFAKLAGESSRSVTVSGDVVGTPHYIAPEAWEGAEATPQADIYALGCVVYEMMTGQKLFQGETPPAVMMAHFKPLTLPPTWPEGVPAEINQVLTTALAREPARRYGTANEMLQALQALSDAGPSISPTSAEMKRDQPVAATAAAVQMETQPQPEVQVNQPKSSDSQPETEVEAAAAAAKQWQQKAEQALAEGNLEGARSATYQWQELMPDAPDLIAFQQRLAEAVKRAEQAQAPTDFAVATPPPQVVVVREERKGRGCLWVGLASGVGFLLLLLIIIGGFCSTLNSTISNILPTVEVGETVDEPIRIPIPDDVEAINLSIEFGSGDLIIRPGAEGALVDGLARYNVEQLKPNLEQEAGDIQLRHENSLGLASFVTSNLKNEWRLKLGDAPLALSIDASAANGDIELGGLALTNLQVAQGAANFELAFSEPNRVDMEIFEFETGAAIVNLTGLANARTEEMIFHGGLGDFTLDFGGELQRDLAVTIDGGAGSFVLIIPEEVATQVSIESKDIDVKTQGAWQVAGNRYTLPGEGYQITIEVNVEGGSLRLRSR